MMKPQARPPMAPVGAACGLLPGEFYDWASWSSGWDRRLRECAAPDVGEVRLGGVELFRDLAFLGLRLELRLEPSLGRFLGPSLRRPRFFEPDCRRFQAEDSQSAV